MSDLHQDEYFLASGGREYYLRNRHQLTVDRAGADPALHLLKLYDVRPTSVVELGCANGWRLGHIHREFGARCVGIDPAKEAVEEGMRDFPGIELRMGTLADVPIRDETFDLVIVYFAYTLNDRRTLLRAFAETERLVRDGGHLIVGDFLADHPQKRWFHHAPKGVSVFKQDYALPFLASGLYLEVARLTFDTNKANRKMSSTAASHDRGSCSLLRKSLSGFYREQEYAS